MKLYALVTNKETKEQEIINNDYPTKSAFADDIRRNDYSVTNGNIWTETEWNERNV